MNDHLIRISKFLSLVLRHQPQTIGLELDAEGWADVDELLAKAPLGSMQVSREQMNEVVARNDKQRFEWSSDGRRIRARQGHSIEIVLNLSPRVPPEILFHGTVDRFVSSIREQGLRKGKRHHVHLSPDVETAQRVGERRGRAVILRVRAGEMEREGFVFYLTENGVWLTDHVPARYLEFPLDT